MKTLTLKNYALKMTALFLGVVLFASCSKDKKDGPGGYPRNVNVEYRVTSLSNITSGEINYLNETGAVTTVDPASLPFSKKLTKKINAAGEVVHVSFYSSGPGSVKLEVLIDGKVVETKTPSSTTSLYETASYGFQ